MAPDHPPHTGEDAGVAVDPVTALGTALSRLDGRVATLADRAGQGPLLVAVVERDCPVSRDALRALASADARLCVVSQGRPEAAALLRDACGLDERDLLVEPAPHPVSDALAARTVPTFVLVEGLELTAWQDGWDPAIMTRLVARAGGRLDAGRGAAGDTALPRASRLGRDEQDLARLEAEDAALPR
jgi:hypothetical protein